MCMCVSVCVYVSSPGPTFIPNPLFPERLLWVQRCAIPASNHVFQDHGRFSFLLSPYHTCKCTCTPSSSGDILRICSHVQQTAGELSRRSQALRAWVRGVRMAPRIDPQHRNCFNTLVPSWEPPLCIHNPLLVSTRSQHGSCLSLQY